MYVSDFEILPSIALAGIGQYRDVLDAGELLWKIHEHVRDVVRKFEPF